MQTAADASDWQIKSRVIQVFLNVLQKLDYSRRASQYTRDAQSTNSLKKQLGSLIIQGLYFLQVLEIMPTALFWNVFS